MRNNARPVDLTARDDGSDDCDIGASEAIQDELALPPETFGDSFEG